MECRLIRFEIIVISVLCFLDFPVRRIPTSLSPEYWPTNSFDRIILNDETRLDGKMNKDSRIFVAGGRGLVGSAIVRRLAEAGYCHIDAPSRAELDLSDHEKVDKHFERTRPEYVFVAAAKVGGIGANEARPVEFLLENLAIQNTLIPLSHKHGAKKLLFLGSTCIYPKHADQPIKESALLTGPLEPSNDAYAIAKIAGIKLCQAYRKQYGFDAICAQPTNLYGPNDNFSPTGSHVIPGIVRRMYRAKLEEAVSVTCWGSGKPLREFLFVDDLADACVFLMNEYSNDGIVNVGTGEEISIAALTDMIRQKVGWRGTIVWDSTKPDGTPRKVCDVSLLRSLGWEAKVSLGEGLDRTLAWFAANQDSFRR